MTISPPLPCYIIPSSPSVSVKISPSRFVDVTQPYSYSPPALGLSTPANIGLLANQYPQWPGPGRKVDLLAIQSPAQVGFSDNRITKHISPVAIGISQKGASTSDYLKTLGPVSLCSIAFWAIRKGILDMLHTQYKSSTSTESQKKALKYLHVLHHASFVFEAGLVVWLANELKRIEALRKGKSSSKEDKEESHLSEIGKEIAGAFAAFELIKFINEKVRKIEGDAFERFKRTDYMAWTLCLLFPLILIDENKTT